jgi:hypothetical protein
MVVVVVVVVVEEEEEEEGELEVHSTLMGVHRAYVGVGAVEEGE